MSASRKEFPVDSRSAWVTQQHIGDAHICISYDTIPVGPGAYSPSKISRHISTPLIGKRNDSVHEIIDTPLRNYSGYHKAYSQHSTVHRQSSEYLTIFHEHDSRMAIDPNLRFCETPGPKLKHEGIIDELSHDGIRHAKKVHFGPNNVPFGERNPTKPALPSYDIKYDSDQIRPKSQLGFFPKHTRFKHYDPVEENAHENRPTTGHEEQQLQDGLYSPISATKASASAKNILENDSFHTSSQKLPLPTHLQHQYLRSKLKSRKGPELTFNDSCYKKIHKKAELVELNPKSISSSIKANMFHSLYAIPKDHNTKKVDMEILEKLKRYV